MPRHTNYIPHGVIPAVLLPFESYFQTFDFIRDMGLPTEAVNRILYANARELFGAEIA